MLFKTAATALLLAVSCATVSAHVNLGNGLQAAEEIVLPGLDNVTLTAPEGYTAAPLRWFGQVFPDGPNITIVGRDIGHVHSKLRQLNPAFDVYNHEVLQTQQASGLSRRSKNDDPQVPDGVSSGSCHSQDIGWGNSADQPYRSSSSVPVANSSLHLTLASVKESITFAV